MSELRETLNVIEIARDIGPEVLAFLKDVVANKHMKLRLDGAISMRDRLQAAEILRKYSALPTNVAVEMGITEKLVYVGDDPRKVEDVTPESEGNQAIVLREDGADPNSTAGPRVDAKGPAVRRNRGRKPKR